MVQEYPNLEPPYQVSWCQEFVERNEELLQVINGKQEYPFQRKVDVSNTINCFLRCMIILINLSNFIVTLWPCSSMCIMVAI